jgi:hypothetical protein
MQVCAPGGGYRRGTADEGLNSFRAEIKSIGGEPQDRSLDA